MAPLFVLLASILAFRAAPWVAGGEVLKTVAGFSPLCAFALCGGAFLPRRGPAYALSAAAVLIPPVIVNLMSGWPVLDWNVPAVLAVAGILTTAGVRTGSRATLPVYLGTAAAGTLLFHLTTNTVAFLTDPGYAKTVAGWWQCQTTGLPGLPPTWLFTARQLAGDLLFTAAFVCAFRPAAAVREPAALHAAAGT